MKLILAFTLVLLTSSSVRAQTWDEWFKQRKTQRKYMLQQIAGLKVYIEYAQKGYAIVRDGLNTISHLKDGDLKLHQLFLDGLSNVNPKIKTAGRVPEILAMGIQIKNRSKKVVASDHELSQQELSYIQRVFNRVNKEQEVIIDQTTVLLSDGDLEMSDDERIKRLKKLHEQMVDIYLFTRSITDEIDLLSAQRKREIKDIGNSQLLNGISN